MNTAPGQTVMQAEKWVDTFARGIDRRTTTVAVAKDTVTVRLAGEPRAVAWSAGVFAGDAELVSWAKALAAAGEMIDVAPPGGYARAGSATRQEAMVAMLGAAKGRGIVVEQDPSLWDGIVDVDSGGNDDLIH